MQPDHIGRLSAVAMTGTKYEPWAIPKPKQSQLGTLARPTPRSVVTQEIIIMGNAGVPSPLSSN
jgi:hypothetical protein